MWSQGAPLATDEFSPPHTVTFFFFYNTRRDLLTAGTGPDSADFLYNLELPPDCRLSGTDSDSAGFFESKVGGDLLTKDYQGQPGLVLGNYLM